MQGAPDPPDVRVGMGQAGAIEIKAFEMPKAVIARIEVGILAGEHKPGREPARGERGRDWR